MHQDDHNQEENSRSLLLRNKLSGIVIVEADVTQATTPRPTRTTRKMIANIA